MTGGFFAARNAANGCELYYVASLPTPTQIRATGEATGFIPTLGDLGSPGAVTDVCPAVNTQIQKKSERLAVFTLHAKGVVRAI